jgi:beta-ureidopropionase / N-carbamoyl-L-amino-acid hydrolase
LQPLDSTATHIRVNTLRLREDFEYLARIGAKITYNGTPPAINRLALSPEDLQARAWFAERVEEAGLLLRDDDAGNLSGFLPAENKGAQTLLVGSHLDSVPDGGRYIGTIGVLAALECARTIHESGLKLPFNLEVMDFTDGEGCWQSLFGALGVAGLLQPIHINDIHNDNAPFRAALVRAGINPNDVFNSKRSPSTLLGYLELHIEQSYRLDQAGVSIGVVEAIVGRSTYHVNFFGQAAHAGTTNMSLGTRKDALQGAAAFITRAHDFVRANYDEGTLNFGDISVQPGKFNMIPSRCRLTMECRHTSEDILAEMEAAILALGQECAETYDLTMQPTRLIHMPAAVMAEPFVEAAEHACETLGVSHMRLSSFAGHEAQIMSTITPCGMIFIPSVGGVSHNPNEFSRWEDVVNGANTLLHTILALAE